MNQEIFQVKFVCAGNICRSVMAQRVALTLASNLDLTSLVFSSSGTGAWHEGQEADPRTRKALLNAGYPNFTHKATQYRDSWTPGLDLIVAMDRANYASLFHMPNVSREIHKLFLLRDLDKKFSTSYSDASINLDVPDPYFGDDKDFADTLEIVEKNVSELLHRIKDARLNLGALPS